MIKQKFVSGIQPRQERNPLAVLGFVVDSALYYNIESQLRHEEGASDGGSLLR